MSVFESARGPACLSSDVKETEEERVAISKFVMARVELTDVTPEESVPTRSNHILDGAETESGAVPEKVLESESKDNHSGSPSVE